MVMQDRLMYSDKKNILQLVALLELHGVRTVVLCPGSRNTPLIHTFVTHKAFECFSVTDERSAGFVALGLAQERNTPVVVCCTSGTALLNIHPAVCEAFYQRIPLIVVSADRPQAWIGQMDGQTLPQPGVFGSLVKKSVHLPEILSQEDEWYCNRLVNEAILECTHRECGPVQINVPLSEPLFQYGEEHLPAVRCIRRISAERISALVDTFRQAERCLILCGQLSPAQAERLQPLLQRQHAVVLSEHLSNLHFSGEKARLRFFDAALSAMDDAAQEALAPDLLITFGGHIVSKRLKKMLRKHPPREHWHITPQGEVVDLFCALTHVVETTPEEFFKTMVTAPEDKGLAYRKQWIDACHLPQSGANAYSSMMAVEQLLQAIPPASCLHLANSSAVRLAALFPLPADTRVFCNRGTSGIEGSLSTAIGYASVSGRLNFVLIGDLSFFYDMNALWNGTIRSNLRILLLNNQGGGIFHTLPGMDVESPSCRYVEAKHQATASGWVKDCGLVYCRVENAEQLSEGIRLLTDPHLDSPVLVEVFSEIEGDAAAFKAFFSSLKN